MSMDMLHVESEPATWTAPFPWLRHLVKNGRTVLSVLCKGSDMYEIGVWRHGHFDGHIYASTDAENLDTYLADVEPLPPEYMPVWI